MIAIKVLCFFILAWEAAGYSCVHHGYYDIDFLSQGYWKFILRDSSQCINGTKDGACTVYFGVCQSLPSTLDACPSSSGVCMETNITDSKSYHNEIGSSKHETIVDNATNISGFVLTYKQESGISGWCNHTITTSIMFMCDSDSNWNPNDHDVTPFFTGAAIDPNDHCLFVFFLKYSGACIKNSPVIPDICSLKSYDLLTLSDPVGWNAVVDKKYCFKADDNTADDACNLLFSFCKPLPEHICQDSVFCQKSNSDNSKYLSFGNFSKDIDTTENDNGQQFTIVNYDGTRTKACSFGLSSTLIFVCNSSARWTDESSNPIKDITKFITVEPKVEDCKYIVKFNYSGACSPLTPLPPGSSSSKTVSNVLGWMLFAVVCIFIVYAIVGVIVQAARGKKGMDLVPNLSLWKAFFIYVLEGCHFTLDVITCKRAGSKTLHSDYDKL